MASAARKLLSVDEFLELEFSGMEGFRVELDNGVISMMAGGSARHARIQRNLIATLYQKLKGSGCTFRSSVVATMQKTTQGANSTIPSSLSRSCRRPLVALMRKRNFPNIGQPLRSR